MGLFLNNKDHRSELQNRVATELNERLKQKQALEYEKPEPSLLENQHQTRPAALVLTILAVAFLVLLVILLVLRG